MGKDADSRAGRRPDSGDEESNKMAVTGPVAKRMTMLFRYMKTASPSEEASSRTLRHTGVRGVGGEVKRRAVEIKDIWRAGWLALAGFGCGGRLTNLQRRRMGF